MGKQAVCPGRGSRDGTRIVFALAKFRNFARSAEFSFS
jgi:hypothetical protein